MLFCRSPTEISGTLSLYPIPYSLSFKYNHYHKITLLIHQRSTKCSDSKNDLWRGLSLTKSMPLGQVLFQASPLQQWNRVNTILCHNCVTRRMYMMSTEEKALGYVLNMICVVIPAQPGSRIQVPCLKTCLIQKAKRGGSTTQQMKNCKPPAMDATVQTKCDMEDTWSDFWHLKICNTTWGLQICLEQPQRGICHVALTS